MVYFVWMTTRKLRAGALDDFERVWQPNPYPDGLARAYAYWSEDGQEIIGVSFWDSKKSCDAWRDSEAEKEAPPGNGALRARGPGSVLPRSRTGHSWPAEVTHHCGVPSAHSSRHRPGQRHRRRLRPRQVVGWPDVESRESPPELSLKAVGPRLWLHVADRRSRRHAVAAGSEVSLTTLARSSCLPGSAVESGQPQTLRPLRAR
jgi:heme-degrading monooxygenase HmoA